MSKTIIALAVRSLFGTDIYYGVLVYGSNRQEVIHPLRVMPINITQE